MTLRPITILCVLFVAGCAAATKTNVARTEGTQQPSSVEVNGDSDTEDAAEPNECHGDTEGPRQCELDYDCCPGFTCGWDPGVSDVVKVCISAD